MKHILLFDIDGTLLQADYTFLIEVINSVFSKLASGPVDPLKHSFAGRTDHSIFRELSSAYTGSPNQFDTIRKHYIEEIQMKMTEAHIDVFDGAEDVLLRLQEAGFKSGLCTGNFRETAHKKVEAAGLLRFFNFGAYGCTHSDRNLLPACAHLEYCNLTNRKPDPSQYIVIGDTPNDIRCARYFGAKVISVTTGSFSRQDLKKYTPDYIADNLEEAESWIQDLDAI